MSKRERQKMVRLNRRRLFLEAWKSEKGRGASLSEFCRRYGLCRNNFYRWLWEAEETVGPPPIRRIDREIERKVLEIFHRYRGTWDASTIVLAMKGTVSAWTVSRIIRSHKKKEAKAAVVRKPESFEFQAADIMWSIDLTQVRCGAEKYELAVIQDEASRFRLGWYLLKNPNARDVSACLEDVLSRYSRRPLLLKSDNAQIFKSREWEYLLAENGILRYRIPPRFPRAQGKIERGMRELKTWLRSFGTIREIEDLREAADEGMWMLNFLKPKGALHGRTPASAYFDSAGSLEAAALRRRDGLEMVGRRVDADDAPRRTGANG